LFSVFSLSFGFFHSLRWRTRKRNGALPTWHGTHMRLQPPVCARGSVETACSNRVGGRERKRVRRDDNAVLTGIGVSQGNQKNKNCMKTAIIIVRLLLGPMFIVFGLNIFFSFMPQPPPPEGPAGNFIMALTVSHYFYVVGALEVAGGALLLAGRLVPLGLTLLGPIIVNILCFHLFLEPSGLPVAIV